MNVEHFVMFLDISHTFGMTRLFVSFRQSVATRNLPSQVYSDVSHLFDMTDGIWDNTYIIVYLAIVG